MKGSTLRWAVFAGVPILFLGFLAIAGRTQVSTYDFPEYTAEDTASVYAYRPALEASAKSSEKPLDESLAVKALDAWLEGLKSGLLQDILPAGTDDQGSTGVRDQITSYKQEVLSRVLGCATRKYNRGGRDAAAILVGKIVLAADAGKYSGAGTINLSGITQIASLRTLIQWEPTLAPDTKKEVEAMIRQVRSPQKPFEKLAETIRRHDIEDKARLDNSITSFKEYQPYNMLASVEYGPGRLTPESLYSRLNRTRLAPDVTAGLTCAIATEGSFQKKLQEAKRIFASTSPASPAALAPAGPRQELLSAMKKGA